MKGVKNVSVHACMHELHTEVFRNKKFMHYSLQMPNVHSCSCIDSIKCVICAMRPRLNIQKKKGALECLVYAHFEYFDADNERKKGLKALHEKKHI